MATMWAVCRPRETEESELLDNDGPLGDHASLTASIDTTKASIARVYDAFLGGKDHYQVDQAAFQKVEAIAPEAARSARMVRQWLIRVSRYLAGQAAIEQFLDCGAGLPSAENTHHSVQGVNPEATVIYVDNDPMVSAHGRALLEENERTHFCVADLTQPKTVLEHPTVVQHLNKNKPIGLILCAAIHHVSDEQDPRQVVRTYIDALPSGSYLALSHFFDPENDEDSPLARQIEQLFLQEDSMGTGWFRTREQIASYFDGLELVEPGITELYNWWPDGPETHERGQTDHLLIGAVGRKP